nr:hypothetical protein [uncultured bacterium]AMP48373.1 hypothetical protein [uncultured bacterium]
MKCNKPYTVKSDNAKMSGSAKPMGSYMGGGMVKSYQKGGMVTKPRKMGAAEFTRGMMEDPRNKGAGMRNAKLEIEMEMEPKYSAKEKMEMERVKGERMTKKMQDAYKRFYNK